MKRYVWSKRSRSYHDMDFNQERCNVDDIKDAEHGDSPPAGRRLCLHCELQKKLEKS